MRQLILCLLSLLFITTLKAQTVSEPPAPQTFVYVEQMPEFPGGNQAFQKYVSEHLVYPDSAKKNNIEGTVYLNFIVDTTGNIQNIRVVRGVDGLNEAAVKLMENSPKWKVGKQNGKPVNVIMNIPIRFSLADQEPVPAPKH